MQTLISIFAPLRDLDTFSRVALGIWLVWYLAVIVAIVRPSRQTEPETASFNPSSAA